jgi:cell division protein FtsQ
MNPNDPRSPSSRSRRPARPNRKRRNYLPYLLGALCFGLVGEAASVVLTSPRFAIRTVTVEGVREIPKSEALRAAAIPMGSNLFLFKARDAANRVAGLSRVRRVEIHRRIPNRLVIRIEERQPVALLAVGLNYYLVDETGLPYARLEHEGVKLPVLRLKPAPTFVLGQPLKNAAFEVGMKSLAQVSRSPMRDAALWVDSQLNLCLNKGDFSARLGQPDDLNRKLKLLKNLLEADPRLPEKAQYVDLSVPEAPAALPRESAGSASAASLP